MNKVYLLQVEVYSTYFGILKEKNALRSELFFSHEDALEQGKKYVKEKVEACYKASDYCDGNAGSLSLEDFLRDEKVYYRFTITEIDPELLENYIFPEGGNYHLHTPAHVEYEYDLEGSLIGRNFWWYYLGLVDNPGVCFQNREGDELEGAGKKFLIGDFVNLKRELRTGTGDIFGTDTLFVVYNTPRRADDGGLIENMYNVSTVGKWGEYIWDLDFHYPFQGIHESELVKYEGEVDENGPFMFLKRLYLDEIEDAEAVIKKLIDGKVLLTSTKSWWDIPELKALAGEDLS